MRITADPPRPADLLLSPLLLASLALLVVNDWVLKPAFHNAVTGKLSDVAGVAALALVLRAVFPRRGWMACLVAGAAFVAWKSPASQPLIDAWNGVGWWTAGRVVDWTDLLALIVLPFIDRYHPPAARMPRARRVLAPAVGAACMLAFAATTIIRSVDFPPDTTYAFPDTPDELLMRMYDLRVSTFGFSVPQVMDGPADTLEFDVSHAGGATVYVELRPGPEGSVLRLLSASSYGEAPRADGVRAAFEAQVVEPLRRNRPRGADEGMTAGPAVEALAPRVLSPHALYQARDTVRVSLARAAYVALVEITPQDTWHVIYPVDAADERLFAAGVHTLATACARAAPGDTVPPGRDVPPCGVARRVTSADARAWRDIRYDPCVQPAPPRGSRLTGGSLVLFAADAPLRRAALDEAVRGRCSPAAWYPMEEVALAPVMRGMGVRDWALVEVALRR
jgi:hypothetical protein